MKLTILRQIYFLFGFSQDFPIVQVLVRDAIMAGGGGGAIKARVELVAIRDAIMAGGGGGAIKARVEVPRGEVSSSEVAKSSGFSQFLP